jgi:hypothetical protein
LYYGCAPPVKLFADRPACPDRAWKPGPEKALCAKNLHKTKIFLYFMDIFDQSLMNTDSPGSLPGAERIMKP